jgi:hypothetical protein
MTKNTASGTPYLTGPTHKYETRSKNLAATNGLAYFGATSVPKKKSFISADTWNGLRFDDGLGMTPANFWSISETGRSSVISNLGIVYCLFRYLGNATKISLGR